MTHKLNRRHVLSLTALAGTASAVGLSSLPAFAQAVRQADGHVELDKLLAAGSLPEMVKGSADAPVTIVEYASVTCVHCAHFMQTTLPLIDEKYIQTGKVRLIFREFATDPRAIASYMIARCAPEDRYFPIVEAFFANFDELVRAPDARVPLFKVAEQAQFDQQSFEACLTNDEVFSNIRAVAERANTEFGVNATPSFFINGDKYEGALSFEEMSAIIDNHLAQ